MEAQYSWEDSSQLWFKHWGEVRLLNVLIKQRCGWFYLSTLRFSTQKTSGPYDPRYMHTSMPLLETITLYTE